MIILSGRRPTAPRYFRRGRRASGLSPPATHMSGTFACVAGTCPQTGTWAVNRR